MPVLRKQPTWLDDSPRGFDAEDYAGPVPIHYRTRVSLRKAVYQCALYFRREFNYDFVQFGVQDTSDYCAFLFIDKHLYEPTVVGACCFIRVPSGWHLDWVWMHPYQRGKGRLSEAWPYFRKWFGDFTLEHPLSPAMQAFLEHHG